MHIPFLSSWLAVPGEVTPLWRHPSVSLFDWLIQLVFPLLMPLKKVTTIVREQGSLARLLALRKSMNDMDAKLHDSLFASWSSERINIGPNVSVLLMRPPGSQDELLPLLLWLHGGGFTLSNARDSYGATNATDLLAKGARFVWASVDYRLAPEHPFPAAPNDALQALDYFVSDPTRSASHGVDASTLHVAGTSAGAGLAAAVGAAAARKGVNLTSLVVDQPMLDPNCASESYTTNGATTVDVVEWLRWAWGEAYLPDGPPTEAKLRWLVSPISSPGGLTPAHPPTLVVTASADPLHDEGVAYADALRGAGKLVHHVKARGSHVLCMTLDRAGRREMLEAWCTLLRADAK